MNSPLGYSPIGKGQALHPDANCYQVNEPFGDWWTLNCENAFQMLIDTVACVSALVWAILKKDIYYTLMLVWKDLEESSTKNIQLDEDQLPMLVGV